MKAEVEKEMKYLISESDYEKLLPLTGNPVNQMNHYFDLPDYCYLNQKTTIRIREKKGKYELTIKQKIKSNENGTVSNEYNEILDEIKAKEYLLNGIDLSSYANSITINKGNPIVKYVNSLATLRSELMIGSGMLQLDKNQYLGVTDYEIEYEYDKEDEIPILKDFIKEKNINVASSISKINRFFKVLCNNS